MLTGSCNSQKQSISKDSTQNLKAESQESMKTEKEKAMGKANGLSIIYDVTSRGYKNYIEISEETLKLSNDRSLSNMQSYATDTKDWGAITSMLENINPKSLKDLKAPTDKRLYDGAGHATLTIVNGDVAYTSNTFDDGFPPSEIKALVNKMLALAEKVKKQ